MKSKLLVMIFLCHPVSNATAQSGVEYDVIFGMHSGLAMLLDVHFADQSNGYGVLVINGCGWRTQPGLDAAQLKSTVTPITSALLLGGYTVFQINHRSAPAFHYPAAVRDAQRAMRFIRFNAKRFGVNPEALGVAGMSSGGHLALLLGTLAGKDKSIVGKSGKSKINSLSSKPKAVAVVGAPSDLRGLFDACSNNADTVANFMGMRQAEPQSADGTKENSLAAQLYAEASPLTHVSSDDAPTFLIHGEKDTTVPLAQSEIFADALTQAGVPAKLLVMPGSDHINYRENHGVTFLDVARQLVDWFDRHLKNEKPI